MGGVGGGAAKDGSALQPWGSSPIATARSSFGLRVSRTPPNTPLPGSGSPRHGRPSHSRPRHRPGWSGRPRGSDLVGSFGHGTPCGLAPRVPISGPVAGAARRWGWKRRSAELRRPETCQRGVGSARERQGFAANVQAVHDAGRPGLADGAEHSHALSPLASASSAADLRVASFAGPGHPGTGRRSGLADRRALPGRRRDGTGLAWVDATIVAVFFGLGVVPMLGALVGGPGRHFLGLSDPIQAVWFLDVASRDLLAGRLPVFTHLVGGSAGVNLAANTTMPALAALGLPLFVTVGPAAETAVLFSLAYGANATSFYFATRRWVPTRSGRVLGALLYGFGPYAVGQGHLHLDLVWVPVVPVVLVLLDDLLISDRRPAAAAGVLLGGAVALQYLISAEVVADMALIGVIGALVLSVGWFDLARRRWRRVAGGLAVAAVTFVSLVGSILFYQLRGPRHFVGPAQPVPFLQSLHAGLLGLLASTRFQLLGRFWPALRAPHPIEASVDLGPLLVGLVVWAVLRRPDPVIRVAGVLAGAGFLLALGPDLRVGGWSTGVPLPEALLAHLPLYDSVVPGRFSLYLFLFAAIVVGRWVGCPPPTSPGRPGNRFVSGLSGLLARAGSSEGGRVALASVALALLLPAWPIATVEVTVPAGLSAAVGRLGPDPRLLTYPFPTWPDARAMLWQVALDDRFRLVGGYVWVPSASGSGPSVNPGRSSVIAQAFLAAEAGGFPAEVLPARLLRAELARWRVQGIVVDRSVAGWEEAASLVRRATGVAPTQLGDVLFWPMPDGRVRTGLAGRAGSR